MATFCIDLSLGHGASIIINHYVLISIKDFVIADKVNLEMSMLY